MKVAMCQTNIIWEDKEKNIEKCIEYIEQAKKHNIELMLFPEMSFTGFSMNINNTKENYNYTVQKISKIARENKIEIVENKPLARSLYKLVDINKMIPPELYTAVAEVLAYIYNKNKK